MGTNVAWAGRAVRNLLQHSTPLRRKESRRRVVKRCKMAQAHNRKTLDLALHAPVPLQVSASAAFRTTAAAGAARLDLPADTSHRDLYNPAYKPAAFHHSSPVAAREVLRHRRAVCHVRDVAEGGHLRPEVRRGEQSSQWSGSATVVDVFRVPGMHMDRLCPCGCRFAAEEMLDPGL